MHPDLVAALDRQHGLATRRQLVDAGLDDRQLASGGDWACVRRGVYLPAERWAALGDSDRWRARDAAASLSMRRSHLLSHDSAARAHDLDTLRVRSPLVHVTRAGVHGTRTEHGVKHHLTRRLLLGQVGGLPCTGLARTALDVAREHGVVHGVVVLDQALRRGVSRAGVAAELAQMSHWPGITHARAALDLADEGAESVGESVARVLVVELGLGRPQTQFAVRLGDGSTAWCDLRLGCHVIEFDGRTKYRRREHGGVADRDPSEVAWRERQRERAVLGRGLGVSRLTWDDLWGPRREEAKQRVRREHAETVRRHGAVLPDHLREYDARVRPRRVPGI